MAQQRKIQVKDLTKKDRPPVKASGPYYQFKPTAAGLTVAGRNLLVQFRRDLTEEGVQISTDTLNNSNNGHTDTGGNQAILNRGGA